MKVTITKRLHPASHFSDLKERIKYDLDFNGEYRFSNVFDSKEEAVDFASRFMKEYSKEEIEL